MPLTNKSRNPWASPYLLNRKSWLISGTTRRIFRLSDGLPKGVDMNVAETAFSENHLGRK